MSCKQTLFKVFSIIDKKAMLAKVAEANEQFQTLTIDIMMYAKFKVKNGVSFDGLVELLRKLKMTLVKIIGSNEFLKTLAT